jgi:lipopolysaccharide/colanic/teichoic acid biosynthesis glycosyltransferase
MSFQPSDDKIRVLRIIARLNIGGPAIHVVNLHVGMDPTRFKQMLVSGTENPGEGTMLEYAISRGVEPIIIPDIVGRLSLKPSDLRALIKLYQLIRREQPHIVHTHTAKAGFLGRLAARHACVPVIVHTFHGHVLQGYFGPINSWLLRLMERALSHGTDRIITVSNQVKSQLVDYGVALPEKITVLSLGFDLEPFLDCAKHRGEFRSELGLNNGCQLLGIVGRIFPIKNHRLFLDAAARIAADQPAARFVVVGDGILRPEMERHADSLGISDRVIFTGWRQDLPRIYADLDALVVSSDNEGTPVSAIEAMVSGCPVVGTRVGGIPDLIRHGETGYLVPPGDASALAAAILRVLQNQKNTFQIAEAARAMARERFSVARLIRDIENLYNELLIQKGVIPKKGRTQGDFIVTVSEPWAKRLLDIILSGLGIILSAPLWLLFVLVIKLEDGGPVFYPQERWGKGKSKIKVYKFRTMVPDADKIWGHIQAQKNDPRITRVGRILRATAVDEMPQLWSIFKGDMSFVGPRSLPINEIQAGESGEESMLPDEAIPGFYDRLRVRPGLTGIAQLYAPRDIPRRHKFRYDQFYIRRMSLWLDIRLLLNSFLVTFLGAWEKEGRFQGPIGKLISRGIKSRSRGK